MFGWREKKLFLAHTGSKWGNCSANPWLNLQFLKTLGAATVFIDHFLKLTKIIHYG
jgi:hypothetical protein